MPRRFSAAAASDAGEAIAHKLTRRAVLGMRYDAGLAREVMTQLNELERDLVGQIARADVTGQGRVSGRTARLDKLLKQTRVQIRDAYRRVDLLNDRDLDDLMSLEAEATAKIMGAAFTAVGVELGVGLPTDAVFAALSEQQLVLGQPLAEWWERAEQGTVDAFARQMRIGVNAGEPVEALARRISGGVADGQKVRGVMDVSRTTARTLVRTSVASVQNSARQAVYDANIDVITAYVHLSRLDSRTSDICIVRANKSWDAKTKQPIGGHGIPFAQPPLHPSCRSVLVVQVVGGDPPPVMDGEAWVASMKPREQDLVLGSGKAQLYRDGKITVRDLIDQTDRPVPLSELVHAD